MHDGTTARTEPMTVSSADGVLTVTGGGLASPAVGSIASTVRSSSTPGPTCSATVWPSVRCSSARVTSREPGIRLNTRDVLLDGGSRLAVAYQHLVAGERTLVVNGVLDQQGG